MPEKETKTSEETTKPSDPKPAPVEEKQSITQHTITLNGQEIAYTATAGTYVLKEEDGTAKASIFYVAYTRTDLATASDGDAHPGDRPITFSFNGGPGSSSVWMHLGMLGPRMAAMNEDGTAPPPPYRPSDNPHSLLDVTDLVFIDPVSTGYSRPAPGEEADQFHGVEKDVESVGEFIRLWTTREGRWTSPKFLIGESYGTTRAAALSGHLQDRHGMFLNGILLISVVLNFQTLDFNPGNDLPFILFLPTFAATAWYHGKLDADLQADLWATLDQVEAFAAGDYTLALMQGAALPAHKRTEIVAQLARFTGLPKDYVEQTNLRINIFRFVKELLRDQRVTVGRLDSRFTGVDRDAAGENFEYDPSYAAIQGLYTAVLNDYLRRELNFQSDLPYEILTSLYEKWDYGQHANKYLNVAETLRGAMSKNPHLRIFVANGYFDLATPYFATEYTLNHLEIEPPRHENIRMAYYPAGHMMYLLPASLAQIKQDMAGFIAAPWPAGITPRRGMGRKGRS